MRSRSSRPPRFFLPLALCTLLVLVMPRTGVAGQSGSSNDWGYRSFYAYIQFFAEKTCFFDDNPDVVFPRPRDADRTFKKSVAAYFWGLPLVEMRRSQQAINDRYDLEANDLYTSNMRNTGDSVVAPNLDVLNSTGFIDFSDPSLPRNKRAFVLSIPV